MDKIIVKPKGKAPLTDYGKFDLHTQSRHSIDSITPVSFLVERVARERLAGFALTDHDSFKGVEKAARECKKRELVFVPGMEVTSNHGHVLCLFIQEYFKTKDYLEVLDEVKSQGGIASLAHPFRWNGVWKTPSCIEILNGRTSWEKNEKAVELMKRKNLAFTAGSDAHWAREAGGAYLLSRAQDEEELRKSILRKECGAGWRGQYSNQILLDTNRVIKKAKRLFKKSYV